jgi:hypothetical protein
LQEGREEGRDMQQSEEEEERSEQGWMYVGGMLHAECMVGRESGWLQEVNEKADVCMGDC